MGILSRTIYVLKSKANTLLNRAEDPHDTLDYSYEQMRDELQDVKQGIADLTTQKKRLEIQRDRLEQNIEKHNDQARAAVEQDNEELARKALDRKKQKMQQVEELNAEIAGLQETQDRLIEKKDTLKTEIDKFRTKKETMKAQYDAASAETKVNEALSGVGDEFSEVSRSIEEAENRTEEMEARAEAMDELTEEGAFESALSTEDDIDRELQQVTADSEVDAELASLKKELGKDSEQTEETTGDTGVEVESVSDVSTDTESTSESEVETESA